MHAATPMLRCMQSWRLMLWDVLCDLFVSDSLSRGPVEPFNVLLTMPCPHCADFRNDSGRLEREKAGAFVDNDEPKLTRICNK